MLLTIFAASALTLTGTATAAPTMWQPAGPARLDQQPTQCTLSREFTVGEERLLVQFQTTFSLATYRVTLASATALRDVRPGKVELALAGSDAAREFDAQTGTVPNRKERLLQWYAHDFYLPPLVKDDQNFRFSSGRFDAELSWSGAGEAFRQLGGCHDAVLAQAGVDTSIVRAAPVSAKPANVPGYWATNADYPSSAMRAREEGEVGFLVTIGTDGNVSECRVASSSGFANLDDGTCPLIRRRAKFEPARDAAGAPVTGYYLGRIMWKIPQ
jgi:TonB family protein